ncbi:MAG TPA: adenylate/guanylate cyclase domain-containing protein [Burkholderiales bacterium]|nr:adenylate/guanylate cyclase domain-containing protein [Burkholderiales bacterium]
MPRPHARPITILLAVVAVAALVELAWLDALRTAEARFDDLFVAARAGGIAPDPDIVVVAADERSLEQLADYAGRWPWPRSVHAELVQGIEAQKPRAIVFDILFLEPDIFRPDADELFNQSIAQYGNVFFPTVRQDPAGDPYGSPLADLQAALGAVPGPRADPQATVNIGLPKALAPANWRLGTIDFLADADGVGRRYFVRQDAHGWKIPSLPARVAREAGFGVPDVRSILLSWPGGRAGRPHVSYADLYIDFNSQKRKRDPREFRDKIVVIGVTASGLHDIRPTPVGALYDGVDILAGALDNLKNGNYLREVAPAWAAAVALALLGMLYAGFRAQVHTLRIGALLAAATLLLLGWQYFAAGRQWVVPTLRPLLFAWAYFFAAALQEYLRERRQREQAVREFSRFVNPHVVGELIAHGGLSREGESRQVTMLFSDIRGFTTLSETRTPQEVVSLLNRYFSRQVAVVFRNGGALDKFIGDCIMAIWGAPLDDPQQAEHAIGCALEMADTLEAFRRELADPNADFDVGIGIHSGPAVVGLIGSEQRREYTAIGDTVNVASRIEGLTKGVARILVSEDTMRLCPEAFDFIPRGLYKMKGRTQEIQLFEPRRKTA